MTTRAPCGMPCISPKIELISPTNKSCEICLRRHWSNGPPKNGTSSTRIILPEISLLQACGCNVVLRKFGGLSLKRRERFYAEWEDPSRTYGVRPDRSTPLSACGGKRRSRDRRGRGHWQAGNSPLSPQERHCRRTTLRTPR